MLRTIAIWIFGLLAAGIVGGFLGFVYDAQYNGDAGSLFGVIGGWCVFACLQLSLAPSRK